MTTPTKPGTPDLPPPDSPLLQPSSPPPSTPRPDQEATPAPGLSRRGLLVAGATAAGIVGITTVGQTVTPLHSLALLAPRDPVDGPEGVPINRTAGAAGVTRTAVDADYRFTVTGTRTLSFTVADLEAEAMATVDLPISCVEGWSRGASWRGIPLRALTERAGILSRSTVRLVSLEAHGSYRQSTIDPAQAAHAVLALYLNGKRLSVDHGYPLRLIAPDRPGVLQTKWLHRMDVP